jgi:hypothetical protein
MTQEYASNGAIGGLLPCPFCGSRAEPHEYEEVDATRWVGYVRCGNCFVEGPQGYANNRRGCFDAVNGLHTKAAASAWNRRAASTQSTAPQPAQTQVALTDEQILTIWDATKKIGQRREEFTHFYRDIKTGDPIAFARALLAAQPAVQDDT